MSKNLTSDSKRREGYRTDRMSIPQHKHCLVCGKSMELDGDFCSEKCEQAVATRKKAQRRTTWIMLGVMGIILVLFWVLMPLFLLVKPGGQ